MHSISPVVTPWSGVKFAWDEPGNWQSELVPDAERQHLRDNLDVCEHSILCPLIECRVEVAESRVAVFTANMIRIS